ncbi:IS1595 family transposase [Oceanirhabdus sp. W0125-5]|uniref:IS1595 family transposase n=1 Tax=Oceanirhabdus sp. W0125-5 TaxID=2999116 RepID=UPI0022F2ABE9|nr:IS1595 family transposase [Oceanirhabdus sp. W0125-5]WBW96168.1 IS1595 family transposase [Oceanirhabdus sp. W0125-5]
MSLLVKNDKKQDQESNYNQISNQKESKSALEQLVSDVENSNMPEFIKEGFLKIANDAIKREKEEQALTEFEEKKHEDQNKERMRRSNILKMIIKNIDGDSSKEDNNFNQDIIDGIREMRFINGRVCPHCMCEDIWKYGVEAGKQRYKCKNKECGRTFRDTTSSPMYNSKKSMRKWIEYMICMLMGLTLIESSKVVDINIATAFYWRHKILDGLRSEMGVGNIGGNVEIGHMLVMESTKGKKRWVYDKSRRCGTKNKFPFLHREPTYHFIFKGHRVNYILLGIDKRGNMLAELTDMLQINPRRLGAMFNGRIDDDSVVSTEGNRHYHTYVKNSGLELGRKNTRNESKEYNLRALMSMKREIYSWITRFKGVSSKYMNNYLYWYRFMKRKGLYDMEKGFCQEVNNFSVRSLFIKSHSEYTSMRIKDFKNRKAIYYSVAV